jgi:hypothetical protein
VLVSLGIMGEYGGAIYTQLQHRPYAVELERLNFDHTFGHARSTPVALNGLTAGNPLATGSLTVPSTAIPIAP